MSNVPAFSLYKWKHFSNCKNYKCLQIKVSFLVCASWSVLILSLLTAAQYYCLRVWLKRRFNPSGNSCNCSNDVTAGLDSSLLSHGMESSWEVVTESKRKLILVNTLWDGYVENVLFNIANFWSVTWFQKKLLFK